SVRESVKAPGWASLMTLLSDTAYHSFIGEVEALNTTTIRRLTRSRRHQLLAIAPCPPASTHRGYNFGAKSRRGSARPCSTQRTSVAPHPNLLSRHTQHRSEPTREPPCRTGGSNAQRPPTDLIQNLRSIHQWFDVDDLGITRAKPA